MSESAPFNLPPEQELPTEPVAESPGQEIQHIPVQEGAEQGLGTTATPEPQDEVRPGEEGRETNQEKAWDMAVAGDESRTKAASNRELINASSKLAGQERAMSDLEHPFLSSYSGGRWQRRKDIRNLREEMAKGPDSDDLVARHYESNDAYSADLGKERPDPTILGDGLEGIKDAAFIRYKDYEQRAARLETWAGTLHEHPVSEAYKEAHPGLDVTPEALVALEDKASAEASEADLYEHVIGSKGFGVVQLRTQNLERVDFEQALGSVAEEALGDYVAKSEQLRDLLDQVNESAKRVIAQGRVAPLRNSAAALSAICEEIKSGRASA